MATSAGDVTIDIDAAFGNLLQEAFNAGRATSTAFGAGLGTVDVDVSLNGLAAAEAQLTALARDRDANINVNMNQAALLAAQQAVTGLGTSATNAGTGFMSMGGGAAFAGLAIGGITLALSMLAPLLLAVTGLVFGLAGVLGALALGFGVVAAALIPVIGAYGDYAQMQDETTESTDRAVQAQNRVAEARLRAAEQAENAAIRVARAETSLEDAQRNALSIQEDLNEARREAARDLEDLQAKVAGAGLREDAASADVASARDRLNRALTGQDPFRSFADQMQAQVRLREALARQAEVKRENDRLREDYRRAQQAGVEGSDRVRAARERERTTLQRIHDAEIALQQARRDQARVAREGAQQVETALQQAGEVGVKSVNKVGEAFNALPKSGQSFVRFLHDEVIPGLKGIAGAAMDGFLPPLQRGMESMRPLMEPLKAWVEEFGGVLGGLAEDGMKALGAPFWRDFFSNVGQGAIRTIQQLAPALGSLAYGFATIINHLITSGNGDRLVGWITGMLDGFGDWMVEFVESGRFDTFVNDILEQGPVVGAAIMDLVGAFGHIISALSSPAMFEAISAVSNFISSMPPGMIQGIAVAMVALGGALLLLPFGPVAAGVGALFGAFIGLQVFSEGFREWWAGFWEDAVEVVANAVDWIGQKLEELTAWNDRRVDAVNQAGSDISGAWNDGVRRTKEKFGWWTGGYTGPGGVWDYAGPAHKGEVIFSQDDVDRWGGWQEVERLRLGGPGFATGGYAGTPALNPSPSGLDVRTVRLSDEDRSLLSSLRLVIGEREFATVLRKQGVVMATR